MVTSKQTSKTTRSPKPDSGRRSFIWKTGAAMSAVLASAVAGVSKPKDDPNAGLKDRIDQLSNQVGSLEDANAIRRLHQAYESLLDRGMYEEIVDMFTDDGEVIFNGGLFSGKDGGIRRLYCERFKSGLSGKKIEPAPGFEPDPSRQLDIVEVSADRRTATGQFPFSLQVGIPMTEDSSLVAMARLQGEGILKWWEGGVHEASYIKVGDSWKIRRLEYRVTSKADFKPGRAYAKPIDIQAFSKVYPADPTGPDKLL
jgi:hypothetical protein